jgi:hypothetical protein
MVKSELTLDYIGPYPITTKPVTDRIEVYKTDMKVKRNVAQNTVGRPRTVAQKAAIRGDINLFSRKSRCNALFLLRNGGPWAYFATINYGSEAPMDGRTVKKHLDRLCTWICRQGVSIGWKIEFTLSGRPHFHLVLTDRILHRDLLTRWAGVIGAPPRPNMVKIGKIRNLEAIPWYFTKNRLDPQNWPLPEFQGMGRFWGSRGTKAKPKALVSIEADQQTLALMVRTARRLAKGKSKRVRKDKGKVGMRLYDVGGESVATAVARHAAYLGVEVLAVMQAKHRKGRKKAPVSVTLESAP